MPSFRVCFNGFPSYLQTPSLPPIYFSVRRSVFPTTLHGFFLTVGNSLQIFLIFIAFARKWNCFKCIWVLLSFFQFFPLFFLAFFISSAMLDISGLLSLFVLFGMPNACKTICSSRCFFCWFYGIPFGFITLFCWVLGEIWSKFILFIWPQHANASVFGFVFFSSKHFPHFSCALSQPILT